MYDVIWNLVRTRKNKKGCQYRFVAKDGEELAVRIDLLSKRHNMRVDITTAQGMDVIEAVLTNKHQTMRFTAVQMDNEVAHTTGGIIHSQSINWE